MSHLQPRRRQTAVRHSTTNAHQCHQPKLDLVPIGMAIDVDEIIRFVMYGEADDAWSPAQQQEMAARLGCPVVVVPGSVHSPAAENPDFTADALRRFLA